MQEVLKRSYINRDGWSNKNCDSVFCFYKFDHCNL